MAKTCSDCGYCILDSYGYSNYTVEGTDLHCSLGLHPDAPFDRFYGTDKRELYAEKCPSFVEDDPVVLDVEREDTFNRVPKYQDYASHLVSAEKIEEVLE